MPQHVVFSQFGSSFTFQSNKNQRLKVTNPSWKVYAPGVYALTGINKESIKAIEDEFVARLCPDLVGQREDLDSAMDLITASHRTAQVMATEYQNPKELERIARAEEAAGRAQERMNQALA